MNRMVLLCVCFTLFGCGKVTADDPDALVDAPVVDAPGTPPNDGPAPLACNPKDPFVSAEPVTALNTKDNDCCAVFDDAGAVYFARNTGNPGHEVWMAAPKAGGFGDTKKIIALGGGVTSAWNPSVTRDGLTLYYVGTSDTADVKGIHKVYVASRQKASDDFGPSTALAFGNTQGLPIDADPFVSADGTWLYVASNLKGTGMDILRGRRTSATSVEPMQPVAAANDASATDNHPVPSADLSVLYFASNRTGSGDLYASYANGEVVKVPEPGSGFPINTDAAESPSWSSADHCELYFTTLRDGHNDIWVARRTRPAQ